MARRDDDAEEEIGAGQAEQNSPTAPGAPLCTAIYPAPTLPQDSLRGLQERDRAGASRHPNGSPESRQGLGDRGLNLLSGVRTRRKEMRARILIWNCLHCGWE